MTDAHRRARALPLPAAPRCRRAGQDRRRRGRLARHATRRADLPDRQAPARRTARARSSNASTCSASARCTGSTTACWSRCCGASTRSPPWTSTTTPNRRWTCSAAATRCSNRPRARPTTARRGPGWRPRSSPPAPTTPGSASPGRYSSQPSPTSGTTAATVGGLLGATATYLGLSVDELHHDPEGYWHLARCRDLIALDDRPGEQLLALEENPPYLADIGPIAAPPRRPLPRRCARASTRSPAP